MNNITTTVLLKEYKNEKGFWVKEHVFYQDHLWHYFINGNSKTDELFCEIPDKRKELEYLGYVWNLKFPVEYPIKCHDDSLLYRVDYIERNPFANNRSGYDYTPQKVSKIKNKKSKPRSLQSAWSKRKEKVLKRDGFQCVICESTQNLTQDHIIPLSRGGTDRLDNKQCMCFRCNQVKGNLIITNEMLKELIKL